MELKKILAFAQIMDLQRKNDTFQLIIYIIIANIESKTKMGCETNYVIRQIMDLQRKK